MEPSKNTCLVKMETATESRLMCTLMFVMMMNTEEFVPETILNTY